MSAPKTPESSLTTAALIRCTDGCAPDMGVN
jgi:hypothetical protein